jgi:hypothetical protein
MPEGSHLVQLVGANRALSQVFKLKHKILVLGIADFGIQGQYLFAGGGVPEVGEVEGC